MSAKEALEAYLLQTMTRLCSTGMATRPLQPPLTTDDARLFDVVTPFARLAAKFGPGMAGERLSLEDQPESLRYSIEHRYSLGKWPAFDFVILESPDGLAWGHTVARRIGEPTPPIHGITDLARWSHVESEVRAALGTPSSGEAWSPWESAIYNLNGVEISLCYVFGLLQTASTQAAVPADL